MYSQRQVVPEVVVAAKLGWASDVFETSVHRRGQLRGVHTLGVVWMVRMLLCWPVAHAQSFCSLTPSALLCHGCCSQRGGESFEGDRRHHRAAHTTEEIREETHFSEEVG